MSLKYFARYRFNGIDPAAEDYKLRHLAVESGSLRATNDSLYGSCLFLDGTTSLLSSGDFSHISDDTDRSISWWSKSDSSNPSPILCYGELRSPNAFVVYSRNISGFPEFYNYSSRVGPTLLKSFSGIPVSTWTFYAFAYNSGVLYVYVNGVLWYSSSFPLTTGSTDPLRIGTDGEGEYFEGSVLDIRVWDTFIDANTVSYMFSVGPNFEEELGSKYIEEMSRTRTITGNLLCRSTYGVTSEMLTQSFYALDDSREPCEAARIEHSQDGSRLSSIDVRVRHTSSTTETTLENTISISPEITSFHCNDDDVTSSVIFSSEGVSFVSGDGKGCIFFGAGRDFRIRVSGGKFVVQALSSITSDYVTKMEVGS